MKDTEVFMNMIGLAWLFGILSEIFLGDVRSMSLSMLLGCLVSLLFSYRKHLRLKKEKECTERPIMLSERIRMYADGKALDEEIILGWAEEVEKLEDAANAPT